MPATKLTSIRDAMLLLAEAPGNADYAALFDAAVAVANARSNREISEAEYRETIATIVARMRAMTAVSAIELVAACDRLAAADEDLTRAETSQRITEIRTGLGQ